MISPLHRRRIFHVAGWALLCLIGCGRTTGPGEAPLSSVELITGNARPDQPLPMVLAVHGFGGSPERFTGIFRDLGVQARVILPRGPQPQGFGFAWFGRCDDGNWDRLSGGVSEAADQVARLIAYLQKTRPTRGLPILSGFSQGGMIAYAVAVRHPEAIRLAIPMSGLLPRSLWPDPGGARRSLPRIRALHGGVDRLVPTGRDQETIAHLKRLGADAELTVYPGVPHELSDEMAMALRSLIQEALAEPAR